MKLITYTYDIIRYLRTGGFDCTGLAVSADPICPGTLLKVTRPDVLAIGPAGFGLVVGMQLGPVEQITILWSSS